MIDGLSPRRRARVRTLDLEEAVEELEHRAVKVQIRCADEILRVLQELDRLRQRSTGAAPLPDGPGPLPAEGRYALLTSPNRAAEQLHARPPPPAGPAGARTVCGYTAQGWDVVEELSAGELRARLDDGAICDRCRRSLHIRLPR